MLNNFVASTDVVAMHLFSDPYIARRRPIDTDEFTSKGGI